MDKIEAQKVIEAAGGNTAFAHLLGLSAQPGFKQRVCNWKRRGIPPSVVLEHQRTLESLLRKAQASCRAA